MMKPRLLAASTSLLNLEVALRLGTGEVIKRPSLSLSFAADDRARDSMHVAPITSTLVCRGGGGAQGHQFRTPGPKNLQYSVTEGFRGSSFDSRPPAKFLGGSNLGFLRWVGGCPSRF